MVEPGRRFAIGDIHGCARALEILLERMRLTSDDTVIVLGDAVDRGPDSNRVLDQLIDVRQHCGLVYILGNHEEMMLNAIEGMNKSEWLRHGGSATLMSYGSDLANIPDEHLELIDATVRYWEGPTEICVHANLEPGVELRHQRSSWLRWQKLSGREFPHPSGKRVICGHSAVGYGAPTCKEGWVCLDTMAYGGGFLTGLELASGEIFQSRQTGEFRGGVYLHEL